MKKTQPTNPSNEVKIQKIKSLIEQLSKERNQKLTKEDFAESIGKSISTLQKYMLGEREITEVFLKTIAKHYHRRGITLEWLLDDANTVFPEKPDTTQPILLRSSDSDGSRLKAFMDANRIDAKDLSEEMNNSTSSVYGYFNSNTIANDTSEKISQALTNLIGEAITKNDWTQRALKLNVPPIEIPLISIKARASFHYEVESNNPTFDETVAVYGLKKEDAKDAYAIEIDGDSMEPQLRTGTKVLAYKIAAEKWHLIKSDKIIAVSFDKEFTVKRLLRNRLSTESYLELIADAPPQASMTVQLSDIKAIFLVDEIIKSKVR